MSLSTIQRVKMLNISIEVAVKSMPSNRDEGRVAKLQVLGSGGCLSKKKQVVPLKGLIR